MDKLIELKNAIKSNFLFKTEDGVDIFEGEDFVYGVIVSKASIISESYFKIKVKNLSQVCNSERYNHIIFSTKEKAENYILMNKPILSIKEICPIVGQCNNNTYVDLNQLTKKLKELVKSKL